LFSIGKTGSLATVTLSESEVELARQNNEVVERYRHWIDVRKNDYHRQLNRSSGHKDQDRFIATGTLTLTSVTMDAHVLDKQSKPTQKRNVYARKQPFLNGMNLPDLDKPEDVAKILAKPVDMIGSHDFGQRNTAAIFAAPFDCFSHPEEGEGAGVQMVFRHRELEGPTKDYQQLVKKLKQTCADVNIFRIESAVYDRQCKRTDYGIYGALCLFYGSKRITRALADSRAKRRSILERRIDLHVDEPARQLELLNPSHRLRFVTSFGSSDDRSWRPGNQEYKAYARMALVHAKNENRQARLHPSLIPKREKYLYEPGVYRMEARPVTSTMAPSVVIAKQNEDLTTKPCPITGDMMEHPPRGDRVSVCPICGPFHRDGAAATSGTCNVYCALSGSMNRTYRLQTAEAPTTTTTPTMVGSVLDRIHIILTR
jgi:hypothetical protein